MNKNLAYKKTHISKYYYVLLYVLYVLLKVHVTLLWQAIICKLCKCTLLRNSIYLFTNMFNITKLKIYNTETIENSDNM